MSDTSNTGGTTSGMGGTAGADRMREGMDRARDTFNERVVEPAKRAGEAMRSSNEKWTAGNAEIGLKMLDQAESNVHKAFEAMRQAARAKDLSEVMKIQAEFMREQSSRSVEQAKEIGEMIASVGRDAVAPLRPGQSATGGSGSTGSTGV
jgi:phasin family protein